jgi:hypothetical protein
MLILLIQREWEQNRREKRQLDEIMDPIAIQRDDYDDEFLPSREKETKQCKGSRYWRNNLMSYYGFSLRLPHVKLWSRAESDAMNRFQVRIHDIKEHYPPDHIVNMDETSWKMLNYGFVTIVDRGNKTVNCFIDGYHKICLITIATIDAAGWKFPSRSSTVEKKRDTSKDLKTMKA